MRAYGVRVIYTSKGMSKNFVVRVIHRCALSTGKYGVYLFVYGTQCGAVGCGTVLQAGRSRVRFPTVSLEFLIDIILPAALWPWGRLSL
jgi:hypothetical protein